MNEEQMEGAQDFVDEHREQDDNSEACNETYLRGIEEGIKQANKKKNPIELGAYLGTLERVLKRKLEKLKGSGDECVCGDTEYYDFIHYGNLSVEIDRRCVNCGGCVEIY